jgi:subtilisin family serine protease
MRRAGWIAVAVFVAVNAFGGAIQPNDLANDELLKKTGGRVIVAFDAVPAARGGAHAAAAARDLFGRFHSDLARLNRDARILSSGARASVTIRHEYSVTFVGAAVEATPDAAGAMARLPYVRHVYRDSVVHTMATAAPSGTVLVNARTRVDADSLPSLGDGVRVGVIDTGVDYTHPALGGGFGTGFKVAGGYDFVNDDGDPRDDNGHGTHVCGTIAGNSDTIIGVAPHATLFVFKVLDMNGSGTTSDVIAGIERVADPNGDGDPSDHVDVANMSLGGSGGADDPQSIAVDNAVAAGVVMCVAAGNAGGFASIGTPGCSREAVTVGAIMDDGTMTSFSSRGPVPHSLDFKPDVVAPGYQIVSSWPGASSRALNGTSMATPHVAGTAALLKALHPDWSAHDIKAALIASATALPGLANERGAGRVDAALATRQTVFVTSAGVSFGIDATQDGTYSADRTYSMTNRSANAVHMTAAVTKSVSGISVTATPSRFTLAPGQSQAVAIHAQASSGSLGFPDGHVFDGEVTFSGDGGSTPVRVPWLLVRAARLTLTYDAFGIFPSATAPDGTTASFSLSSDTSAETYVTPGKTWDIFLAGYDPGPGYVVNRILLVQNQAISGDKLLALSAADAPYAIALNARDENGAVLGTLPVADPLSRHFVLLRLDHAGKSPLYLYIGRRELFYISKLPGYTITAYEWFFDADHMRFFNVRHAAVDGAAVHDSIALEKGLADYRHGTIGWRPFNVDDRSVTPCARIMLRAGNQLTPFTGYCVDRPLSESLTADYFATPSSGDESFALILSSGSKSAAPLRPIQEGMVLSSDAVPGPLSYALANGQVATVGVGPLHPYSLFRAILGAKDAGFIAGALDGGQPTLTNGTNWEVYDDRGALAASGTLPKTLDRSVPVPLNGRIHAWHEGFFVDGHYGRFDADMITGSYVLDTTPPSIGSLRLLASSGNAVEHVANGDSATLHFTAADIQSTSGVAAVKSDATTVSYRVHGTAAWQALTNVVERTEVGEELRSDYALPGDVNRVDLSAATAHANSLIDLQVAVTDAYGNRLVWTQSPAFVVGDVPVPPKRRAAR